MDNTETTQQGSKWGKKKVTTAAAMVVGAGLLAAGGLAAGNSFATMYTGAFAAEDAKTQEYTLAFLDSPNTWVPEWKVEFDNQGTIPANNSSVWNGGQQAKKIATRESSNINKNDTPKKYVATATLLINRPPNTPRDIDKNITVSLVQSGGNIFQTTLDHLMDYDGKTVSINTPASDLAGTQAVDITAKATGTTNVPIGVSEGFSIRLVPASVK